MPSYAWKCDAKIQLLYIHCIRLLLAKPAHLPFEWVFPVPPDNPVATKRYSIPYRSGHSKEVEQLKEDKDGFYAGHLIVIVSLKLL